MIPNAVATRHARLPILPEEWRRYAPELCEGIEADYLLIDLGPSQDHPRYTIMGLGSDLGRGLGTGRGIGAGGHSLHLADTLSEIHAPRADGGLGVDSSLFVPLYRQERQQRGHIAALYSQERHFDDMDVEYLQAVAARFVTFLSGR